MGSSFILLGCTMGFSESGVVALNAHPFGIFRLRVILLFCAKHFRPSCADADRWAKTILFDNGNDGIFKFFRKAIELFNVLMGNDQVNVGGSTH